MEAVARACTHGIEAMAVVRAKTFDALSVRCGHTLDAAALRRAHTDAMQRVPVVGRSARARQSVDSGPTRAEPPETVTSGPSCRFEPSTTACSDRADADSAGRPASRKEAGRGRSAGRSGKDAPPARIMLRAS